MRHGVSRAGWDASLSEQIPYVEEAANDLEREINVIEKCPESRGASSTRYGPFPRSRRHLTQGEPEPRMATNALCIIANHIDMRKTSLTKQSKQSL